MRKILCVVSKSYESKVDAIVEERNLKTLAVGELICSLMTHELNKKQGKEKKEVKKEKYQALKIQILIQVRKTLMLPVGKKNC